MKKIVYLFLFSLVGNFSFAQDDEPNKEKPKSEIGVDGYVSASNLGGIFSLGLKYAMVKDEKYAYGPSFRMQRLWSNNLGNKYGFNIIGAGGFFHYRLKNVFFVGAEIEMLKSPLNLYYVLSPKKLVPTCFIGGGYSQEFKNIGIRVNAAIFYDVVNDPNSPFRTSYFMKNANGALMPVIYRIGLFFPLN